LDPALSVAALIERDLAVTVEDGTPLTGLPMDSLDFVALLQAIRQEIGDISDDDAMRCNTVGDLARAVRVPTGKLG
jgi:acyl carrier protein